MNNRNILNLKNFSAKFNYYFSKKKSILIFLLLLMGVLVPTLSGSESYNFWYKLFNILNNPVYNMLLFISIGINAIYMANEFMSSYFVISRYQNIKNTIKEFEKDIIVFTIFLLAISFIIAIAGAIIFSFGDFRMINHPYYDFPIIYYILFFLIRSFVIATLVNSILYLFMFKFNKIVSTFIILINGTLFFSLPDNNFLISHFYNMNFLYHYYYNFIKYSSFFLEIIISIIEIIILIGLNKFVFWYVSKEKRDLI